MGLANIPLAKTSSRTHMSGVMRAVVGNPQQFGFECRGQRRMETVGAIFIHARS